MTDSKNWLVTLNGKRTRLFTLENKHGIKTTITNFGGRVVSLLVPDKNGNLEDIVLGYDNIEDTINGNPYFGSIVGRYANRIAKGKFFIDNKEFTLSINNGSNALHGGVKGYHNLVFDADHEGNKIILKHLDPDMHEGYPGNLDITVIYELTDDNELKISFEAITDKPTIVNLTNHSFFNLHGAGNGEVLDHKLMINADSFTPIDATMIPSGNLKAVKHTPFDFTELTSIGKNINVENTQLKYGHGFDHNWVLNKKDVKMTLAAKVVEPISGRVMEVHTTEPGLQFYTSNFLTGKDVGKGGKKYEHRSAFCLETQHFPDSPNQNNFPSAVLRPGEKYQSQTIFAFSVSK